MKCDRKLQETIPARAAHISERFVEVNGIRPTRGATFCPHWSMVRRMLTIVRYGVVKDSKFGRKKHS